MVRAFDLDTRRGDLKRAGQGDSFTGGGPGRDSCESAGIEVRLWKAKLYTSESGRQP